MKPLSRDERLLAIATLDDPLERVAAITIHEDLEYFRTKPTKNWRIRAPLANEKALIDARLSLEHSMMLVFRDQHDVFFKAIISAGPHNDLLDPWIFVAEGRGAIRASSAWKLFQQAGSYAGRFLDTLSAAVTTDFAIWCAQDIARTARLSQTMFTADPEANLPETRDALAAGAEAWGRWDEKRVILVPDMALVDRVKDRLKLDDSLLILPSEPTLIALMSMAEGIHGYFVDTCDNGQGLRIGELLVDGRIGFVELRLNQARWNHLPSLLHNDAIANPGACAAALGVLNAYGAHIRRGGKAAQYIGVEILPPMQLKERLDAKRLKEIKFSAFKEKLDAKYRARKEPSMVMQSKKTNPVDALLAQIQAAYDSRLVAHTKRIAEFRKAVSEGIDTYASAAEQDLLVDFAVRNQVENAGELRAGPAASHLLELIGRLPELGGKEQVETPAYNRTPPEVVEVEIEEAPAPDEFSKLVSQLNDGELFIVGGLPKEGRLAWMEESLGLSAIWINTEDDPDSRGSARVAHKMREVNKVAAVLFCKSFMSHVQTQTLIDAGREFGIPVVACGKGGTGEILRALRIVEKGL